MTGESVTAAAACTAVEMKQLTELHLAANIGIVVVAVPDRLVEWVSVELEVLF